MDKGVTQNRLWMKLVLVLIGLHAFVTVGMGIRNWGPEVEFNCYQNYARSIVADGDLNILNNADKSAAWLASTTFNYPEMHDHGVSVFWSPFYWLVELLGFTKFSVSPNKSFDGDVTVTFILSVFFLCLTLSLLRSWANELGSRVSFSVAVAVFFGTGLFYYSIFQFNGTEMFLAFLSIFSVYWAWKICRSPRLLDFLWLGIVWGFLRIVKIHSMTYLLPFAYFYLSSAPVPKHIHIRRLLLFALGFLCVYLPMEWNNFQKFGFFLFGQGYLDELVLRDLWNPTNWFTTFFGATGFFSHTPLVFVASVTFFYLLKVWWKSQSITEFERVGVLLFLSVMFKWATMFFYPTPGTIEFGGRNFIIDTGAYVFILASLSERWSRRPWLTGLIFVSGMVTTQIFFLWYNYVGYLSPDQQLVYYVKDFSIVTSEAWELLKLFGDSVARVIPSFFENLKLFIVLLPFAVLAMSYSQAIQCLSRITSLKVAALCFLLLYWSVTGLNTLNNRRNADKMRSDPNYSHVSIGNGQHIFTFDNVATDFVPLIEFHRHRRDRKNFDLSVAYFKRHISLAATELLEDKAGFKAVASKGLIPRIGVTDDDSASVILDFDGESRFRFEK